MAKRTRQHRPRVGEIWAENSADGTARQVRILCVLRSKVNYINTETGRQNSQMMASFLKNFALTNNQEKFFRTEIGRRVFGAQYSPGFHLKFK